MNLKEAYEKTKKDYRDWTIAYILETKDMYIFSMHPKDGIILELPVLCKNGSYEMHDFLDILHISDKEIIRKINPEDL